MTDFQIICEREETGAYSAYVLGLPIYAQADTAEQAQCAVRKLLMEYLVDHLDIG